MDQSLNDRRMDDYQQINFAMQVDADVFCRRRPSCARRYISTSKERITPKYNPLDQDVELSDAWMPVLPRRSATRSGRMPEQTTIQSFSISGFKFDVKSKNPMPWDPANFTLNFSFNKQRFNDPTTEYQNTDDYRGSFQYAYSPFKRGVKPSPSR